MLDAIAKAERSIALMTYIFDNDAAGKRFVEALGAAVERGVDVRVIIDDAGIRYSRPTVQRALRKRGVRVVRFMRAVFSRVPYMNLRTHRKLLVVDGRVAFTGGMNIRDGHLVGQSPKHPVRDIQFRLEGPVVAQLLEVFGEDWRFCSGETLDGDAWRAVDAPAGESVARTIPDGPDEDHDRLRWAYLSGLAAARRSVRIVTPYFLPDQSMTEALAVASYRGVRVDVVIPYRCNLFFVQWAVWGQLLPVIESCRVWLSPPPFDHTKLMIVDDEWVLIGSGNWDPRSYRLNFELDVEIYDATLAGGLAEEVDRRIAKSKRATRRGWHRRKFPIRLRDSIARLFAPYL
jgi:cardiolipin synthase